MLTIQLRAYIVLRRDRSISHCSSNLISIKIDKLVIKPSRNMPVSISSPAIISVVTASRKCVVHMHMLIFSWIVRFYKADALFHTVDVIVDIKELEDMC